MCVWCVCGVFSCIIMNISCPFRLFFSLFLCDGVFGCVCVWAGLYILYLDVHPSLSLFCHLPPFFLETQPWLWIFQSLNKHLLLQPRWNTLFSFFCTEDNRPQCPCSFNIEHSTCFNCRRRWLTLESLVTLELFSKRVYTSSPPLRPKPVSLYLSVHFLCSMVHWNTLTWGQNASYMNSYVHWLFRIYKTCMAWICYIILCQALPHHGKFMAKS